MKTLRLLGAALCLVLAYACGSDDDTRRLRDAEGGAAGDENVPSGGMPEGGTTVSGGEGGRLPASEGGEGGGTVAPRPGNDLYVSPTGSDEAAGTESEPFLTIEHAATLAEGGDRIHLLDGTFDSSTQPTFATNTPIPIPAGVTLQAKNPGQAVLLGAGPAAVALEFIGDGELRDVDFVAFGTAVRASAGALTISGLRLQNFDDPSAVPLELSGTAAVSLTPGESDSYVTNGFFFANLDDDARLSIEGGTFEGLSGAAEQRGIFTLRGDSELSLSGVDVLDTAGEVVFATDTAKVSLLSGTTIDGTMTPANANIELQGESELVMNNATLSSAFWAHISTLGAPTVSITGSTLTDSGSWALIVNSTGAPGTVSVTIQDSEISGAQSVLGQIDVRRAANLIITDSEIKDGANSGIFLGDNEATSLMLRRSTISGNGQSAVRVGGHPDSVCDLGTVGDLGENTLLGNGTTQPALLSYLAAGKVCHAVGNTWTPDVQGASPTGTYAVSGAGAKLDVVGPDSTGLNYWIMLAGSTLRLAENP